MAKEPYKDPFPNLPRRAMFVDDKPKTLEGYTRKGGQNPSAPASDAPPPPPPFKPKPDMKALAEMVVDACDRASKKRGPKKGAGGRPKKEGEVSRWTKQRRRKAAP